MNQTPPDDIVLPPEEKNPLEFWAAYIPGVGKQRHYLGNGKTGSAKGIRLFKSQQAAWDYLKEQLDRGLLQQETYDRIIVHAIEGKLAMPAIDKPHSPALPYSTQRELKAPDHLKPIITLHKPSVPTPVELLDDYLRRKKKRRRHS